MEDLHKSIIDIIQMEFSADLRIDWV